MKLEVGMYVRTKHKGIIKINDIIDKSIVEYEDDFGNFWEEETDEKMIGYIVNNGCDCSLNEKDIIKASHNIINLIEAGDYVNELPVEDYYTRYDEEKDDYIKIGIVTLEDYWKGIFTSVEDIKSIVTREQFSAMEYRLGDK